jgi:hypothetical protein
MPIKPNELKERPKYRVALQKAAKAVAHKPVEFWYFEGFAFSDGKPGALLLLGPEMTVKLLVDAVKDSNAMVKGRGKCAFAGGRLEFLHIMGKLDPAKLKADVGSRPMAVVKAFSSADQEDAGAAAGGTLKELATLKADRERLAKRFSAKKADMSDAQRKSMHVMFGAVDDRLGKAKPAADDVASARNALKNLDKAMELVDDSLPALQRRHAEVSKDLEAARKAGMPPARQREADKLLGEARKAMESGKLDSSELTAGLKVLDALDDLIEADARERKEQAAKRLKMQAALVTEAKNHRAAVAAARKALEADVKAFGGSDFKAAIRARGALVEAPQAAAKLLARAEGLRKALESPLLQSDRTALREMEKVFDEAIAEGEDLVRDAESARDRTKLRPVKA